MKEAYSNYKKYLEEDGYNYLYTKIMSKNENVMKEKFKEMIRNRNKKRMKIGAFF
jgi:hypothetical protein